LNKDLSYELIKGDFKSFKKITIDINKTTAKQLKELITTHENSSDTIRFEFVGDESKLKALDKSLFNGSGIDVKIKYDVKYDYKDDQLTLPTVIEHYGEEQVKDAFKSFCNEKGYEYQEGIVLLNEYLKR